jgi:hypothetical protein
MKGGDMKNLLVLVVLAAVLITAGCTGGNRNPAVTPAGQIVTPAPPAGTPTPPVVSLSVPVTPGPADTAADLAVPGSYQTYTNSEFRFAIQIPACWTASGDWVTTAGGGRKYKILFDDPTFTSMQYITITPGSSGLNLEDWDKIFLNQLKADPSVAVVGESPEQLDGVTAKKLDVTTGSGSDELESTIIMVIKGDNAYFMEFESRKADYPRFSLDADRIIKTLKFT